MDCQGFFKKRVDPLRGEGRYRVSADLERRRGRLPTSGATAMCILLLEQELAGLHGREAALTFTSGYVANDGPCRPWRANSQGWRCRYPK
jgi:hypothetical protein